MNTVPLPTRDILCFGIFDDAMANRSIAQLLYFQAQSASEPVTLVINSPGGTATAVLAMIDTMKVATTPVHTRALTQAVGVALLLLAAGEQGHRTALEHTFLSITPLRNAEASLGAGRQEYAQSLNLRVRETLASLTRLTVEEAGQALDRGRDFEADEAVELGIVDSVAER